MKKMTTALLILFSFALVSCGDKSKSGGGSSGFSTSAYSSGDSQVNFITGAVTSGGVTYALNQIDQPSQQIIRQASASVGQQQIRAVDSTQQIYRATIIAKVIQGYSGQNQQGYNGQYPPGYNGQPQQGFNGQNQLSIQSCTFINP
jgi:hypothetical protein